MDKNEKQQKYETLIEQVKAFSESERDEIALMANVAAIIHETFHFWWTGFYRVVGQELVLGPFQGPVACTRIKFGRGVCGTAWKEKRSIVVEDVEEFPGHIACSSASRSEIVVPISARAKLLPNSTSTARILPPSTKPTSCIWKRLWRTCG